MSKDGSRIEAAEAGVHTEHAEHGAHDHVDAHGAAHDDHGGGHGHGADPNAGVVRADAPTPAWVGTATVVALITIAACIWLAFRIG